MDHCAGNQTRIAHFLVSCIVTVSALAACARRGVEVVSAEPLATRLLPSAVRSNAANTPTPIQPEPSSPPAMTDTPAVPSATVRPTETWAGIDPNQQTVILWHPHTYSRRDALLDIVKRFNRSNEWGITVKAEYQGEFGELFDKTLEVLNTPGSPHLVLAYQDQAVVYYQAEGLADINSLVKNPKWGFSTADQEDFFPSIWAQDVFPGFENARLGIPAYRSMDVLYYNTEWLGELKAAAKIDFDGPPLTPEQFKTAACAAVENAFSKAQGEEAMGYELSASASRFASWTFAFGGEVYDAQNNRYTYASPAAVEAMQFIQDLFLSGCADFVSGSYGDQDSFGAGRLLFTVGTSSGLPFYQQVVEEGARFAWGVAALPHTTPQPAQNIYGPSLSLLKTTPQGELAAWLFLKYFTSPEAQVEWAAASHYYPVRLNTAQGLAGMFTKEPAYEMVFSLLPYGKFEPPVPGYEGVRRLVSEAMAAIANGADVTVTLKKLNEEANSILAEQLAGFGTTPLP